MIIKSDAYETNTYRDCARKFDLRINQNLVAKHKSAGRGFGSIMHKAREVWRLGLLAGKPREVAYLEGLNALELDWSGAFGQGVQVDERRSLENARKLYQGYIAKFGHHDYKTQAIEIPFDIPVGVSPQGHTVHRTGIFDEFCLFNGRPYVLDFKTSSVYPGGSWFDGWRTSEQFMGYVWAARRLYGECHGVIVHGMWVHAPPKTGRGKYKFEDYFTADIITFTDSQLEEWRNWFLRTCDRRAGDMVSGEWEPNWDSTCKAYNTTCDYFKWCTADQRTRPMIEGIYYDKIAWTPLAAERLTVEGTDEAA